MRYEIVTRQMMDSETNKPVEGIFYMAALDREEFNMLSDFMDDLKRRKDYEKRRTEDRDRLIKIMKDTDKLESKQPES